MSMTSLEEKISTKEKSNIHNYNKYYYSPESEPIVEEEEKLVKYKSLPNDFNSVSLKTRFTCGKMLDLVENNKVEDLSLEDFKDPSKAEINQQILNRKLIQFYCKENAEKHKFASPSEKTMKKLQQFKQWQKFEIFQKDGIKNYLNNILPDYRLIDRTKALINNEINLYTKLRIKRKTDSILLPIIDEKNDQINKYIKDTDLFNEQTQSYTSINDKNAFKNILIRNKSMGNFIINPSKTSKPIDQKPKQPKHRGRKSNKLINNRNSSLINLIDNKLTSNNKSLINMKSFEDSTFCYNRVDKPVSINKSITISRFGGALLHSNSLLRNKSMNDLISNASHKSILERLNEYKTKRNKIIANKDYLQHIGKTFVTINRHLGNYDYNIF